MFMAACFCAYVRNNKKYDILAKLDYTNEQLQQTFFQNVNTVAGMMNTRSILQTEGPGVVTIRSKAEDDFIIQQDLKAKENELKESDFDMYMPILT